MLHGHIRRHLGSPRSCRECVQSSHFNFTPSNVLWVAFPARTNSLSDGSQENNTFNHTSSSLLQHLSSSMVRTCQNKMFGFFEVPVSHHCFPSTNAHFSTTPSATHLMQTMSELHNVFNIRNLAAVTGQCFRSYWKRTLSEGGLKERKKKKKEFKADI